MLVIVNYQNHRVGVFGDGRRLTKRLMVLLIQISVVDSQEKPISPPFTGYQAVGIFPIGTLRVRQMARRLDHVGFQEPSSPRHQYPRLALSPREAHLPIWPDGIPSVKRLFFYHMNSNLEFASQRPLGSPWRNPSSYQHLRCRNEAPLQLPIPRHAKLWLRGSQ